MKACLSILALLDDNKAYFKVATWDETGIANLHTEITHFLKGASAKKQLCSSQLHPRVEKTLG